LGDSAGLNNLATAPMGDAVLVVVADVITITMITIIIAVMYLDDIGMQTNTLWLYIIQVLKILY
jgi:hypothetical protein